MLNNNALRTALKDIFQIDDSHLVLLNHSDDIPNTTDDPVGDWIGYGVLSKRQYVHGYMKGYNMVQRLKVIFRVSFVGPHAEELADSTWFWNTREDVVKAFAKCQTELLYEDRLQYARTIVNTGINDSQAWVVDFTGFTAIEIDTQLRPWWKGGEIWKPTTLSEVLPTRTLSSGHKSSVQAELAITTGV